MQQEDKRVLWYLKKVPLLADLTGDTLGQIADLVEMKEIRRRQVIYLPGDPGSAVYVVNGGRVKVSKVDARRQGADARVPRSGRGLRRGLPHRRQPREEMAEAMENALVTEIERSQFEKLLSTQASLGYRMTKILAQRRREMETKIENLVFKDVNSKLAELLLRLAAEYGVDDSRGTLVALKITHQEMANLIGSTRETVSLTLAQFKRKGLIQTEGRKVIIADREGLRALA
jgi:CRP-like cAMP-binding protein